MTHLLTSWQNNKNYFCVIVSTFHWFCNGLYKNLVQRFKLLFMCIWRKGGKLLWKNVSLKKISKWNCFDHTSQNRWKEGQLESMDAWKWLREKKILLNKLTSSVFSGYKVVLSQTTVSRTLYPTTQKQFTQAKKLNKSKKEVRNRQPLQLTSFALSATVKAEGNATRDGFLNFQRRSRFCSGLFLNICDAHCWLATDAG